MMVIQFQDGVILFEDDKIAMDADCCCDDCCMQVTFSASSCLGGTYNLSQATPTRWSCLAYNSCFSSNPQLMQVIVSENEGTWFVTVTVDGHTWEKSYIEQPNPCTFVGESISHDSSGVCNTTGTTATLTANSGVCPSCGKETCDTTHCKGGSWTGQIDLEISNNIWTDADCDFCSLVGGTYTLDHVSDCIWIGDFGVVCDCADFGDRDLTLKVQVGIAQIAPDKAAITGAVFLETIFVGPVFVILTQWVSTSFLRCEDCFPSGGRTLNRAGGNPFLSKDCCDYGVNVDDTATVSITPT